MTCPRMIRVLTLVFAALATTSAYADFRLEIKPLMNGATGRERPEAKSISIGNNGNASALGQNDPDSGAAAPRSQSLGAYAASLLNSSGVNSQFGAGSKGLSIHASVIGNLATEYAHSHKDDHGNTPSQIELWQETVSEFAHDRSHHGHWDPNDSGSDHSHHRGGGRSGPGSQGGDDGNGTLEHAPVPASALLATIGMCTIAGARFRRLLTQRDA